MTTTQIKKSESGSGDARSLLRNSAASITGQMANLVVGLVSSVYVARMLGKEQFGIYQWALGLCTIVNAIANIGVDNVIIREVAKDRKKGPNYLVSAFLLKIVTSSIGYLCIVAYLTLRGYSGIQLAVGYLLCSTVITESFNLTCRSVLTAYERQDISAVVSVVTNILRVASVIVLVYLGFSIVAVSIVTIVVTVVTLGWQLLAIRRLQSGSWLPSVSMAVSLLSVGWTFLITDFFLKIFDRADYIMLDIYRDVGAVGIYGAAYRIIEIVSMIGYSFSLALFPIVSRRAAEDSDGHGRAVIKATKYLAMFGIPLSVGIFVLSGPLMNALYGSKYQDAGLCLSLLIWSRIASFVILPGQQSVAARNAQLRLFPPVVARMVINIGMNLYLIPRYGYLGACWAMIVSENVYYLLNYIIAFRGPERFNPVTLLAKPVFATCVMALVIREVPVLLSPLTGYTRLIVLHHSHSRLYAATSAVLGSQGLVVVLATLVGIAVYAIVLNVVRGVDDDDKAAFRQLLQRGRC